MIIHALILTSGVFLAVKSAKKVNRRQMLHQTETRCMLYQVS